MSIKSLFDLVRIHRQATKKFVLSKCPKKDKTPRELSHNYKSLSQKLEIFHIYSNIFSKLMRFYLIYVCAFPEVLSFIYSNVFPKPMRCYVRFKIACF